MTTENINEIIASVLANEADAREEAIFRSWLEQSEENKQHFELLKQEWETNRPHYKVVNAKEIKDRIWREGMDPSKRGNRRHSRNVSFNYSFYFKIAAVFVLFISTTVLIIKYSRTPGSAESTWITKANPAGQKSKVFLPDGSEVWLNVGSELRYLEKFTDSARLVYLKGEAFFSVVKDWRRPFTVISNDVITTALGTSFNVNAFKKDIKVALVSGKVKVAVLNATDTGKEQQLVLKSGEVALFNSRDKHFTRDRFDIEEVVGWKAGILYFKDAPFSEITEKLELWYGVDISVKESKAITKHYTGKFNNENLKNVLESMSFALDFDYELKDKTVAIYAK